MTYNKIILPRFDKCIEIIKNRIMISKDKVVSSGTSLNEDKSIDKADIYSTEETGTRHLDRAQEKPVEKVEDKQKGSWRIKEGGGEET
ncbi:MAG: hypothetical protein ACJ71C_08270 [Nitrososphaeraceae archaeon]